MRLQLDVAGQEREATVHRQGDAYVVEIGGRRHLVEAAVAPDGRMSLRMVETGRQHAAAVTNGAEPGAFEVGLRGARVTVRVRGGGAASTNRGRPADGPVRIAAPMPGKVVRVLVRPGEAVSERQPVIVVEAMKMENELRAARDGVVREVLVTEGASVEAGAPLVVIA